MSVRARLCWLFLPLAACIGRVESLELPDSELPPPVVRLPGDAGPSAADAGAPAADAGPVVPADAGSAPDAGVAVDAGQDAGAGWDGGFFGPPRCAGSGLAICDDFESGQLDPALWSPNGSNGTVTVDASRAARGTHSLHLHASNAGGTIVNLTEQKTFPAAGDTVYGRAFVYFTPVAPQVHATFFEATGTIPGTGVTAFYRYGAQYGTLLANYDTIGRATDYPIHSATAVPLARWACMEWAFKGDTSELHFWLDERELTDLAVLPSHSPQWTAPAFTSLNLGLRLYATDPAPSYDLWLDEVAIDGSRIGCAR